MEQFETLIHDDLQRYLLAEKEIDVRMPDATDIEELWNRMAEDYMPDGVREFAAYPTVSLGWMMYLGMATAKHWDTDWATFSTLENPYLTLRDIRGFDCMDEYIREDVLHLSGNDFTQTEKLVQECAERTYASLRRQHIQPGTKEAFHAYVACLHQLYLMGAAVQLFRMGYKMTAM